MAKSNDIEISLKVVIDREKKRVVFAEANGDFVDVLFSFLTLPMGTIVRLLAKHSANSSCAEADIGGFNNLYRTVSDLEAMYFRTKECKDMLINTRNSAEAECQRLKINVGDIKHSEYFTCAKFCYSKGQNYAYVRTYKTAICKNCWYLLNRPTTFSSRSSSSTGVFATNTASFVITNDLHVIPNNPILTLEILESYGITDFGVLEENTLKLGSSEFLNLLQYSFSSKTPLTDLVFGKISISSPIPTSRSRISTEYTDGLKLTINIFVQMSNNKILLAHSSEAFIDFLFSFLTIPLGRVFSLLSKDYPSTLSIENIHRTISELNVGEYLKSQEAKDMLLDPKLSKHYLCSNQIFPLEEATLFWYRKTNSDSLGFSNSSLKLDSTYVTGEMKLESLEGEGGFVRGPTKFMVTDNLVVTPLSSFSCIKYLQGLGVPPTDIEEQVINIGMEEGVNLLRATLISASVLTSGLEHLILKKPKQEQLPKNKSDNLVKPHWYGRGSKLTESNSDISNSFDQWP